MPPCPRGSTAGRRAGQAGRHPQQSPPNHQPTVHPTIMLLLLHLLPAMLPTAALASCTGAGADRQLILAKVRARVLEHLSPPLLQEKPQKEARRVHRRDVLKNDEVEPEELEDTSQVILFPSTGENTLVRWRGQRGEGWWGIEQWGCSGMERLLWGSAGKEQEGMPSWGAGMGKMWWKARRWKGMAGRHRQSSPGHRQGEGQAAQRGAKSLGNSWSRWHAVRYRGLRRRQGGIRWDARERVRMLGNGMG